MRNKTVGKTVFLDRDGVINRDSSAYIKRWEEFEFLPRSLDALRLLTAQGISIILITNQSVIGRHMVAIETLMDMHRRMARAVADHGGAIQDIFFCPHVPGDGCNCRKPRPGMLLAARDRYQLDLSRTVMVGDSVKDVVAARRAGCGRAVLVRTGNGETAAQRLAGGRMSPDHVADDLLAAARWITGHCPL